MMMQCFSTMLISTSSISNSPLSTSVFSRQPLKLVQKGVQKFKGGQGGTGAW